MRRHCTLLAVLACAWLAACGDRTGTEETPAETASAAPAAPAQWRWRCDDDVTFDSVVHPDHIVLYLAGGAVALPQVVSASGTHYREGDTSFWSQGGKATLEFQGDKLVCHGRRDPWDEAQARGVVLRAIGQEPGWTLEISGDTMHLLYDYAEREAVAEAPEPEREGAVTTWVAMAGSQRLRAAADEERCVDTMSGEAFPLTVTVEIDDRRLHGCGRRLGKAAAGGRDR